MVCWKVGIGGRKLLDPRRPGADTRDMAWMRPALLILALLCLPACGGLSSSALDGKVKNAIVAQHHGLDDVSSVDCSNQAPPPDSLPGNVGSVHAEHTCTITFDDGRPQEVWAVHVLDLGVSHPVQLLYRVDGNAPAPAPAVDVATAFSSEMAVLESGHAVSGARCRPGTPAPPSGAAFAPADHVCVARVSGSGRQRWAVRIVGSNVQLLFKLS
jgi:hypothetical protein